MNKSESKYFNTARTMDIALLELLEKKDLSYITVKEICEKAGVNRSTFYLHYETINDLLGECSEYINEQFLKYMKEHGLTAESFIDGLKNENGDYYLITPKYLGPYLNYIKEHKRQHYYILQNANTLNLHKSYQGMFQYIFSPILDKYQVDEDERRYILAFYMKGLMAIIMEWLKDDCEDPVEYIISLIQKYVGKPQKKAIFD